jgi:RNA polymerase sigma factor (sigma-70 family)
VVELSKSDAGLAARACGGDVEALAEILERYRSSLYAAAIGMLKNREEALDAVQETCVVALVRLGSLRVPEAVGGWLHAVLRNVCLMRLRCNRTAPSADVPISDAGPSPDQALDRLVLRNWLWTAIGQLSPEERVTVMLRYFTRSCSYDAIASATGVPVGTVRSRLNRARTLLADGLQRAAEDVLVSQTGLEQRRRDDWEDFYSELHERPEPRTYARTYASDVEVTDCNHRWRGLREWSAHEREAILLGVQARIIGLIASRDVTVLEIDFTNPDWAAGHCPPRSTFVHRLAGGRSRRLDIHYV